MNVVLYSTGCPKCDILKKKLADNNIRYTENNDVDEMLAMGIKEVPVLSVNGELMNYKKATEWILMNKGDGE